MSQKKNKNDYIILGTLTAITIIVLSVIVLLDFTGKKHPDTPGLRTSVSINVDGVIVCYTLFEKLGIPVTRSEKAFIDDTLDKTDVMFILDQVIPLRRDEIKNLNEWLIKGGVLISTYIPEGINIELDNYYQFPRSFEHSTTKETFRKNVNSYIPQNYTGLPLARDISSICFQTKKVFNNDGVIPKFSAKKIETLLQDDSGIRIAECRLGSGCIIILSDTSFLANGQIGINDNSVLTVNLVSYAISKAKNNNVAFDEYHLNPSFGQSGFGILSKMLLTTTAGWSVLSLTVAGIFYIIYKGRRFGYRRSIGKKQRRSKLEYIYSVGSTYRSAGANQLTLKLIYEQLRHKVAGLTGLNPNASNVTMAKALSGQKECDFQKCIQIFDKCDKLMSQKSVSERHLLSALKELGSIEMEIFNEHRNNT